VTRGFKIRTVFHIATRSAVFTLNHLKVTPSVFLHIYLNTVHCNNFSVRAMKCFTELFCLLNSSNLIIYYSELFT